MKKKTQSECLRNLASFLLCGQLPDLPSETGASWTLLNDPEIQEDWNAFIIRKRIGAVYAWAPMLPTVGCFSICINPKLSEMFSHELNTEVTFMSDGEVSGQQLMSYTN